VFEAPLVVLDPVIVNELRSILWSSAKTKVHADMFRRAGTFVFHRAQLTWFRELRSSYLWVGREYENDDDQAARVTDYLGDFSVIENVIENQPDPVLYDDIVENSNLYTKFLALIPSTRKPILDALDRISAFRMKAVQTLREARALRTFIKHAQSDNLVVRKLMKNMKSYLDMENFSAPFHDDEGVSSPPSEGTALVSNAIFDFARSSMQRQLLTEYGERFLGQRISRKVANRPKVLSFYKYVEPLHEIEMALLTKPIVQSQCVTLSSGPNSKNSSGSGSGSARIPFSSASPLPAISLDVNLSDGEEVNPPPSSKKASFLSFLRSGKQRHSPLVRHVRNPGSAEYGTLRSSDLLNSPKTDDPSSASSSPPPLVSSIPMTVPSFDEVLGSTYFRKMMTDYYFSRVDEDEANAWDDLTAFYAKYSKADDEALYRSRETALKQVKNLIDANRVFLSSFADELDKRISSSTGQIMISANFFRKAERALFSKAYDAFVQYLVQSGWKLVPIAVGIEDDDLMFV